MREKISQLKEEMSHMKTSKREISKAKPKDKQKPSSKNWITFNNTLKTII